MRISTVKTRQRLSRGSCIVLVRRSRLSVQTLMLYPFGMDKYGMYQCVEPDIAILHRTEIDKAAGEMLKVEGSRVGLVSAAFLEAKRIAALSVLQFCS